MKETESQLVRAVIDLLLISGIPAWRVNTTGVFDPKRGCFRKFTGLKGVSDVIGVLAGGRILCVECKRKPNKPTDAQQQFLDAINRAGGLGIVVYGVDELEMVLNGAMA